MGRLVKLQFIGPILVVVLIIGAEVEGHALAFAPSSRVLWYLNSNIFGPMRLSEGILDYYLSIEQCQLYFVASTALLAICAGLLFERALMLAIISNLSFLYAALLVCAQATMERGWSLDGPAYANMGSIVHFALFGCTLLSFASSHVLYLNRIRREHG
jgi:hypothetical protein